MPWQEPSSSAGRLEVIVGPMFSGKYDDPIILVSNQNEGYEARCRRCHKIIV